MSRRKPKGKSIRPTFWIFCEGETEREYISMLKKKYRLASVSIASKIAGHKISKSYIEKFISSSGKDFELKDRIYLMYDLDVKSVLANLQKIHDANIVASNPCIELWFLLHYEEQVAPIQTSECVKRLSNLVSNYQKGKITSAWAEYLDQHAFDAVDRALKLTEYANPSSLVYKLIHDLEAETGIT